MRFDKLISPEYVYFDMDGTLFDLYGVPDWLPMLRAENPYPYEAAAPMVDMERLRQAIQQAIGRGARFGVVSWLSKDASPEYKKAVRQAKREALQRYLGLSLFHEIHLVQYGTPKHHVAEIIGTLIDDDFRVREAWQNRGGHTLNPLKDDMIGFVEGLRR